MRSARHTSVVVASIVALSALFSSASTHAQQQCFYGPVALPGLAGTPEWFDFDGDGFWRPELHDPRWSGTPIRLMKFATNNVGVDEAQFRVLKAGDVIYVSLQSRVDDTPATFPDAIYVALTEGAGLGGHAIKLLLHTSGAAGTAPADPDGSGPIVVPQDGTLPRHLDAAGGFTRYWHTADASSGAGWDATPSTNYATISSWFKDIAIWTGSPGVAWAVTFRLDLGPTGLNAPGDPKLFVGVESNKTVGTVRLGNVAPDATTGVGSGSTIIPLNSANWEPYVSSGTACAGVTLDRGDVGKWTGAAGSAVGSLNNVICANTACGDVNNVFSVTARKVPNASVADWVLRARLRIAAWGSTIDDWKFAPWKDIAAVPAGVNVFSALAPPASGAQLTNANGWYWLTPVDAGDGTSAVTIQYQCNRGSDPYCPKLVDETEAHQCMLVELGQPGTELGFTNNAVYRNMDYSGLSTIDVPATISLKGLQAANGGAKPRDVYFYVQAENLPAPGREALGLPTRQMDFARQLAEHPIVVPRPMPVLDKARLARLTAAQKLSLSKSETTRAALLKQAGRIASDGRKFYGKVSTSSILAMGPDQLIDSVWPTYRVHPYYDSGQSVTEAGSTRRILVPMVPFGFHLSHDGPLYGFEHALEAAAGGALENLGHGWFKLKLEDEKSAQVRTRISADEKPSEGCKDCEHPPQCPPAVNPGPHGCGCGVLGSPTERGRLAWGAFALGLGAAWLLRARRRRQRTR